MKITQLFILLISISLLISCKDAVINASTYETMTSSYNTMLSSLPDEEKKQFSHAYNSIIFSYQNHVAFREKGDTRKIIQKRLSSKIGGMNASQIIKEYQIVRKKRALWDIKQLEKNIATIKNNDNQLSLVTIDQYKLYVEKDGRLNRIFLNLVIHNGSKYKLTSASFLIRVGSSYSDTLSPQKKTVFVIFSEGLEPGKDAHKKIDLGYPSSQLYLPKDPILEEYTTSRISGLDVDLNRNIYPTLEILTKTLEQKNKEYLIEFSKTFNK